METFARGNQVVLHLALVGARTVPQTVEERAICIEAIARLAEEIGEEAWLEEALSTQERWLLRGVDYYAPMPR